MNNSAEEFLRYVPIRLTEISVELGALVLELESFKVVNEIQNGPSKNSKIASSINRLSEVVSCIEYHQSFMTQ